MVRARLSRGRVLFYSRDSGGKHEQTPSEYVKWAMRKTEELGLQFQGTPEIIKRMIKSGSPVSGDLYFDYCVSGNLMNRPALDALRETIRTDLTVSHILIPRRDRLARPDEPMEGVLLEKDLRENGITLVFMNQTLEPLKFGKRQNIAESIAAVIDYHQSGEFRSDLAEKMIYAQLELARNGFSTGGRAPYGFQRVLMRADGTMIRALADGEIVRQAGHHVVWLPVRDERIQVVKRILEMLLVMPACRVAEVLNSEGIPSPDSGRSRTDNGVRHLVNGKWNQSSIINIGRHPLMRALCHYGRRAMGDQRRMTPEGPRLLIPDELTSDRKPRVIRNAPETIVTAKAHFDPLLTSEQFEQLSRILDERAGTQRGKPRSKKRCENPLGGRIHDMNCTWPMYRIPYQEGFRYTCGKYQQSRPRECSHNHVDGLVATRFALAAIRQMLLCPTKRRCLEEKLRNRIQTSVKPNTNAKELKKIQAELDSVTSQLSTAKRNMALAKTSGQFDDISQIVEEFKAQSTRLARELERLRRDDSPTKSDADRVAEAIAIIDQLPLLAGDSENLAAIGELFRSVNLELFLSFSPVQKAKRIENKLLAGVLTLGKAPAPIKKYSGPTGRRSLTLPEQSSKKPAEDESPAGQRSPDSDRSAKSLGNVNRGDRTAIELFLAGIRGWEAGLRRLFPGKSTQE